MSLAPPTKVEQLQKTLHAKAKGSPNYRFYALYDKVYRADVLWHAYRICQSNGGSAGVDGQTFDDIEKYGRKQWLDELTEELRMKRYRPKPVRRVHIPKPGKSGMPLFHPTRQFGPAIVKVAFGAKAVEYYADRLMVPEVSPPGWQSQGTSADREDPFRPK